VTPNLVGHDYMVARTRHVARVDLGWWRSQIAGADYVSRRQEGRRRREEASRVVGAVIGALRELDPDTWGDRLEYRREQDAGGQEEALGTAAKKRERWLAASDGLEILVAQHPQGRIAACAERVITRGNLVSIRLDEVAHGARIDESWRTVGPG
jgi:hypothetical protein